MKTFTAVELIKLILFFMIIPQFGMQASSILNEKSKTITKTFAVNEHTELNLKNKRGDIEIINIEGSEGRVEVLLTAKSKNEEELDKFLQKFEVSLNEYGSRVEVSADDHIKSWSIIKTFIKSSNTIIFDDGTKIKDIEEIDVMMKVFLPKIARLKTKNKYHDVRFSNLNFDLVADLYSGNLLGGDIHGRLDLTMKYGEVNIGSIRDAEIEIYDSEYSSKNGGCISFKSKYSNIMMRDLESLEMLSYEDDIELGELKTDFEFDAKYSDVKMGSFDTADLDIYDTDIEAENGNSLKMKSKYGSGEFEVLGETTLFLYEDDFDAIEVENLMIKESKYSDISIKNFKGKMDIRSSYDDEIAVLNQVSNLKGFSIEAKYTELRFPIPSSVAYILEASTKYGEIKMTDDFDRRYRDKDGSEIEIKGMANGGNENSPKVEINAYDSRIFIEH